MYTKLLMLHTPHVRALVPSTRQRHLRVRAAVIADCDQHGRESLHTTLPPPPPSPPLALSHPSNTNTVYVHLPGAHNRLCIAADGFARQYVQEH